MAEEKHTHHHHEHDHEHGHHHHHHEDGPLKPGEHPDWRTHVHAPGEHHEVGVNDYLGKPYQEDELIGHVKHFAEMSLV